MSRLATVGVLVLLTASLSCARALADADPASDILLGENVFFPYSTHVSSSLQAALNAEVAAAHRAHLQLKVALIASPIDLGAIPTFFRKPRQYAAFLDQEITFGDGKVPLLVVMPNGYGAAGLSAAASAVVSALPRPSAAPGNALAQAALGAVPKIAVASGRRLGAPVAEAKGTGGRRGAGAPAHPGCRLRRPGWRYHHVAAKSSHRPGPAPTGTRSPALSLSASRLCARSSNGRAAARRRPRGVRRRPGRWPGAFPYGSRWHTPAPCSGQTPTAPSRRG